MVEKRKRREIKTKGETEAKRELIKLPLTSCEDVTCRLHLMSLVITISGHLLVLADRYNRRGLKHAFYSSCFCNKVMVCVSDLNDNVLGLITKGNVHS